MAPRDGHWANRAAVQAIVRAVKYLVNWVVAFAMSHDYRITGFGRSTCVIGTKALKERSGCEMCRRWPGRLALGIDAKNGFVATDGWLETSSTSATSLAQQYAREPLAAIIYTDIAKDGMLAGPIINAMGEMQRAVPLPVIASGGVTTAEDVKRLAEIGMAGAILGRALYENRLSLREALENSIVQPLPTESTRM